MSETLLAAPPSPFKGLMPFEDSERDALLFFGREREQELILANLLAARLTVLYGESGVGKTSLLAAGVVHDLREQAHANAAARGHPESVVLMFSSWSEDPVAGLLSGARSALAELFGTAALPNADGGSLADTLQTWTDELGCDLLLIFDQAEEYFLYHEGEAGPLTFAEQLPDLVARAGLRVSVLLSIREDALAKLDRFKGRIPNLFGNYLRLEHLERESARAAILGPIEQYNRLVDTHEQVDAEPALVGAVLDETAAGRVDLGRAGAGVVRATEAGGRIEAPFLQLVLERLWEEEVATGSRTLRLETLQRLGGAAEIVRGHLKRALEELSPVQQDIAATLFHYLVTPSGTKIAHATGDLADYAAVEREQLAPVLSTLVRQRILRPAATRNGAPGDGSALEIYHDVLTDAVLAWRSRHEAERALELQRLESDRRHRRTLLVAGAAAAALAVVAVIAVFALLQRSEAREQAREARVQRREARAAAVDARAAARQARAREILGQAVSQLDIDPAESLRLAAESARLEQTPQTEQVLRTALIADRGLAVLRAGPGAVTASTFSPDGKLIAVASARGAVRLFREGRRVVGEIRHGGRVERVVISPDGRLLVTVGDRGAKLWRLPSGRLLRTMHRPGRVLDASLSRDGRLLVTAGADGVVVVWSVPDGQALRELRLQPPSRVAVLSPDGDLVVAVDGAKIARLFDVISGSPLLILDQRGISSAAFSQGGRFLATGSADRTARIWDTLLVEQYGGALVSHVGRVVDVAFSPRGTLLATASTDGTGRVWDLDTGKLVAPLIGHTNHVVDVAFSPDGRYVAAASIDRSARVWKADTGNQVASFLGHRGSVRGVSFSPNGARLLTWSDDRTARLWSSAILPELRLFSRGRAPVTDVAFSPDGRLILSTTAAGQVTIRAARGGRRVQSLRESQAVAAGSFSPDGTLVAVATGRYVVMRNWREGRLIRRFVHPAVVADAAFSSDGTRIASAGRDGVLRIWAADSGRLLRAMRRVPGPLTSVAFSPDGALVAAGSVNRIARIWDVTTGSVRRVLRAHRDTVTGVAFSPNGSRIVTASRDHDARVWDVATGRPVRLLRGHFAVVSGVAFSPDGRWVLTAGPQKVGLWNMRTGRGGQLRGHGRRVTAVAFDPQGRRVVSAAEDGTVRLYDCAVCGPVGELLTLAEARLAHRGVSSPQR